MAGNLPTPPRWAAASCRCDDGINRRRRDDRVPIPPSLEGARPRRYRHHEGSGPYWYRQSYEKVGRRYRQPLRSRLSLGAQVRDGRPSARLLCPMPPRVGARSQGHDFGYVVRMIGKSSRMNGVKSQQFDGIGVGTMRPKLDRGPRSTRARPRRLTIEWE